MRRLCISRGGRLLPPIRSGGASSNPLGRTSSLPLPNKDGRALTRAIEDAEGFKYYSIPAPPIGVAGIVAEPTEDLHRLQDALIEAVEPYTVKTGTPAAFFSEDRGRDIQGALISSVENFVRDAAGKRFNPHVTIGVATEKYLNEMLAEPFSSFTFSPAGASIYQLGAFGTARNELKALTLTP